MFRPDPKPEKKIKGVIARMKKAEKSLPQLKKDLEVIFNKFIRQRDTVNGIGKCISCGKFARLQAGHFISVQQSSALRFNENNVSGQCQKCNLFNQGNFIGYEAGLIAKIGKEKVEMLKVSRNNFSKLSKFEVNYLIEEYKKKLK